MTHTVDLEDYKGFDTRQIIACSTEDKKKLEIVLSSANNFVPCFEVITKRGVTKHLDINDALGKYNIS